MFNAVLAELATLTYFRPSYRFDIRLCELGAGRSVYVVNVQYSLLVEVHHSWCVCVVVDRVVDNRPDWHRSHYAQ